MQTFLILPTPSDPCESEYVESVEATLSEKRSGVRRILEPESNNFPQPLGTARVLQVVLNWLPDESRPVQAAIKRVLLWAGFHEPDLTFLLIESFLASGEVGQETKSMIVDWLNETALHIKFRLLISGQEPVRTLAMQLSALEGEKTGFDVVWRLCRDKSGIDPSIAAAFALKDCPRLPSAAIDLLSALLTEPSLSKDCYVLAHICYALRAHFAPWHGFLTHAANFCLAYSPKATCVELPDLGDSFPRTDSVPPIIVRLLRVLAEWGFVSSAAHKCDIVAALLESPIDLHTVLYLVDPDIIFAKSPQQQHSVAAELQTHSDLDTDDILNFIVNCWPPYEPLASRAALHLMRRARNRTEQKRTAVRVCGLSLFSTFVLPELPREIIAHLSRLDGKKTFVMWDPYHFVSSVRETARRISRDSEPHPEEYAALFSNRGFAEAVAPHLLSRLGRSIGNRAALLSTLAIVDPQADFRRARLKYRAVPLLPAPRSNRRLIIEAVTTDPSFKAYCEGIIAKKLSSREWIEEEADDIFNTFVVKWSEWLSRAKDKTFDIFQHKGWWRWVIQRFLWLTIKDQAKRRKRRNRTTHIEQQDFTDSKSISADERNRQRDAIDALLNKLDIQSRHILIAHYRDQWTVKELASFHKLSVYQVYRRLAKARDVLEPAWRQLNAHRFRS